jgi:hypothetical protein
MKYTERSGHGLSQTLISEKLRKISGKRMTHMTFKLGTSKDISLKNYYLSRIVQYSENII